MRAGLVGRGWLVSHDRHADNLEISPSSPSQVVRLGKYGDAKGWEHRSVAMIRMKFPGYHFTLCVNHVRSGSQVKVAGKTAEARKKFKQEVILRAFENAITYNASTGASTPGSAENLGANLGTFMVGDFNLDLPAVQDVVQDARVKAETVSVVGAVRFPPGGWVAGSWAHPPGELPAKSRSPPTLPPDEWPVIIIMPSSSSSSHRPHHVIIIILPSPPSSTSPSTSSSSSSSS